MANKPIKDKPHTEQTKTPNGLSIVRNGETFTCSWNIKDENHGDGQVFEYAKRQGKKWGSWQKWTGVKKTTKSHSIKIEKSTSDCTGLKFRVKGNRQEYTKTYTKKGKTHKQLQKFTWSNPADKTFEIEPPRKPKLSLKFVEGQNSPKSTFTWSVTTAKDDHKYFYRVAWRTRLNNNRGKKSNWSGWVYNTSSSSSYVMEEDSSVVWDFGSIDNSYTREFDLKAIGPGGTTTTDTVSHVYAIPYKPAIEDTILIEDGDTGYLCFVEFKSQATKLHPIDSTEVQYCISVPTNDLDVPASSEGNWQTAAVFDAGNSGNATKKKKIKKPGKKKKKYKKVTVVVNDKTSAEDIVCFPVERRVEANEVVFVRMRNYRDAVSRTSSAVVVDIGEKTGEYFLSPPTNVSVTQGQTAKRIIVSATNSCSIDGSFLIVSYLSTKKGSKWEDIGVIEADDGGSKTIAIPSNATTYSIGVRASIGDVPDYTHNNKYDYDQYKYIADTVESSKVVIQASEIPTPPTVTLTPNALASSVKVKWDWDWSKAEYAELSWSNDPNAWESTDEPSTYRLNNLNNGSWSISNVALGEELYVRVRLIGTIGESNEEVASRWSNVASITLTSKPLKPSIAVSPTVINPRGTFTATWNYISSDNSPQSNASIVIIGSGNAETQLGQASSDQSIKLTAPASMTAGNAYQIAVRVTSQLGETSELSEVAVLTVVNPITCTLVNVAGIVTETKTVEIEDEAEPEEIKYLALKSFPIQFTTAGAGTDGETNVVIKRADSFYQPGPDENDFIGYADEIIYSRTFSGQGTFTINLGDPEFIGTLDDGGSYVMQATATDIYGQTAESDELQFIVNWNHKAVKLTSPPVTAEIMYYDLSDPTVEVSAGLADDAIAKITVPQPEEGWVSGDVVDIYRLSTDKPQLIVQNGAFDTVYVDPYPTIGELGGHRVVYKTKYDDYVVGVEPEEEETSENTEPETEETSENTEPKNTGTFSWVDLQDTDNDIFERDCNIITFGRDRVELRLNVDLDNAWSKDFTETKYLGGGVQGDWNPAVSRTGSISVNVVSDDVATIKALRRLAVYAGSCHVRTKDGSNYSANIDVSENIPHDPYYTENGDFVKLISYSLSITRVDDEELSGMTWAEWLEENGGA